MITVTRLEIKNVGLVEDLDLAFNKPLLLFYGEVRAGKTTVLNAVRWVLGADWPEDIIRHGAAEASIRLEFVGGSVSRSWYRGKDGKTKARDIALVMDNRPVSKPASALKQFLNPFLLNQDYLRNMGEAARKQFFADLLPADTGDLDAEASMLEATARDLRATLKTYGDLAGFNPVPVEKVSVALLWQERQAIIDQRNAEVTAARQKRREVLQHYQETLAAVNRRNQEIDQHNAQCVRDAERLIEIERLIKELEEEQAHLVAAELDPREPQMLPLEPDTTELDIMIDTPAATMILDQKIADASAANVRAEQWEKDKARLDQKTKDEEELRQAEARQREIKGEKVAQLKATAASCGVPGLAFDDEGNVVFEDTTAGMLSTSQIMRLSSALSALFPPGFGLELIDRAESLGESIYTFIDEAERDKKTILATIVGKAPASSPPEVGVFVVKDGKVKQQ